MAKYKSNLLYIWWSIYYWKIW